MKWRLSIGAGALKARVRKIKEKTAQPLDRMRAWRKRKSAERKRARVWEEFETERKPLLLRWAQHAYSSGNLTQAAEYFAEAGEIGMLRDILELRTAHQIIRAREKRGDVLEDLNRARIQMHAIKGLYAFTKVFNGRNDRFQLELKYTFGKLTNRIRRKLGSDLMNPENAKQMRELGMMYAELARHPEGEKYKKRTMEVVYALYHVGRERTREIPIEQPSKIRELDRKKVIQRVVNLPRTYAIEVAHMLGVTLEDVIRKFE